MSVKPDLFEVTTWQRPNETWQFKDAAGHIHQWEWTSRKRVYNPMERATLPTCTKIDDPPEFIDGDEVACYHYACNLCGERLLPGYCADTQRMFVRGVK